MAENNYFQLAQECSKNGQTEEAIGYYKKAVEKDPSSFPAIFNLILQLRKIQSPELIDYVNRGLKLSPDEDSLYSILGEFYLKQGKKEYALFAFNEAHRIKPDDFVYLYNIGTILYKLASYNDAKSVFEKLLEKDEKNKSVLICLAQTYKHLCDNNKALEIYKKCCEFYPDDVGAKYNLAITFNTADQPEKALELYQDLLNSDLSKVEVYRGIGISYRKLHKYDLALSNFNQALAINPDDLETLAYIADMYMYFEKEDTTKMLIDQILKRDPNFITAILYKNVLKLRERDFSGFEYYRLKNLEFEGSGFIAVHRHQAYQGGGFKNKTVLVVCNCGIGDSIMFSRFLPELVKRAKQVIVVVNKPLEKIFKENFPKCVILTSYPSDMKFDIMLNMAILPYYLESGKKIPKGKNSLKINKETIKKFSQMDIFKTDKKKIAFVWRGARKTMLDRMIPLEKLTELFDIEDTQFYSFQLDCNEEEKELLRKYPNILDMKPYISDYTDTAAALMQMDRVISIDTSLIHMAGVVGVKSYLMLPFEQEWRWYSGKNGISDWYETVKMFRQTPDCTWDSVVKNIKEELVRTLYNGRLW